MRFEKINVASIPKDGRYFSKESIGMELEYKLGEHVGKIKIVDIIYGDSYPIIETIINGEIHHISQNNINPYVTKLICGDAFGYNIGDIVSGLVLLKKNKTKYIARCTKDNYEFEISIGDLRKGRGCPVCNKRIIVRGVNDFCTTHGELVKYLKNPNEGYENFYGSAKKTVLKCPNCGFEKQMSFNALTEKGFSCPLCSDGVSFGEKYVASVLNQLEVEFETQKRFLWLNDRFYDFYLPTYNMIIEVHGLQHYSKEMGNWKTTLEEQQENDRIKEYTAMENGISRYIIIDARRSDENYIKENTILQLSDVFDLSKVNWNKCLETTMTSNIKVACDLWMNGLSVSEISKTMNMSTSAIRKYLKQGAKLNWCDYFSSRGFSLRKQNELCYNI